MESSHLVIFSTSGKFITKFNVLRCISLSETLFWTGARGRIPITLMYMFQTNKGSSKIRAAIPYLTDQIRAKVSLTLICSGLPLFD